MMKKPTTILLDGDLIGYRTAAAMEKAVQWDDDTWSLYASERETYYAADTYIERLQNEYGIDDVVIAISDSVNFRKSLDSSYKAHRAAVRRPMTLKPLLNYFKENYDHVVLPTLEADDVIGILVTQDPGTYLVDCADKDMLTIPGIHLTGRDEPLTEKEAFTYHMAQTLMGDQADGYKGCPGIGEKRAWQFLNKVLDSNPLNYKHALWNQVYDLFYKAIKDPEQAYEDAVLNARLSKILTAEYWDAETESPILWEPPLR